MDASWAAGCSKHRLDSPVTATFPTTCQSEGEKECVCFESDFAFFLFSSSVQCLLPGSRPCNSSHFPIRLRPQACRQPHQSIGGAALRARRAPGSLGGNRRTTQGPGRCRRSSHCPGGWKHECAAPVCLCDSRPVASRNPSLRGCRAQTHCGGPRCASGDLAVGTAAGMACARAARAHAAGVSGHVCGRATSFSSVSRPPCRSASQWHSQSLAVRIIACKAVQK